MGRLIVDLSGHLTKLPAALRQYEPTHASRYWIIAQIINSTVGPNAEIVDVGGKEGLLRSFDFKPTVLDIEPSSEPKFVLGNALDMPFKDKSFDVSISCDVLEHIEATDREKFIAEMVRVSRVAVICAPFDNPGVSEVEIEINDYYKSLLKSGHRWLQEHIDNGLPSETETGAAIAKLGYNYAKVRHFSLDIWPKVLKAHLLHAAFGDRRQIPALAKNIYGSYYDELCNYDFGEDGYRTFFIVAKDEVSLKLPSSQKIADKKRKFIDTMIDLLFASIQSQALQLRKAAATGANLQQSLNETKAEVEKLGAEISYIKNSKSWRLARKISSVRHLGK